MKTQKLTEKQVWKGEFMRAISLMGMYIFSSAIVQGFSISMCLSAFFVAGLYFFTAISKFYGLDFKKIFSQLNNPQLDNRKKVSYSFLLWA